jgi:hypothetical protein
MAVVLPFPHDAVANFQLQTMDVTPPVSPSAVAAAVPPGPEPISTLSGEAFVLSIKY